MTCDVRPVLICLLVFFATCDAQRKKQDYQVPNPTVEALYPKGFRVTLKDDGYALVGFRGNINKEFKVFSEGDIKHDIIKPKNGNWVYKNNDEELEIGDKIYYWMYVLKNGKGYMNTDLEYTVNGFVKEDGTPVRGQTDQIPSGPSSDPSNDQSIHFPDSNENLGTRYEALDPSCTVSKTMVPGRTSICKDTLIFDEQFDKTSLKDLRLWDAEIKFPGEPDFPFNVYIPDNTVSFEDGSFVITPILTEAHQPMGHLFQTLDLSARCTGRVNTGECKQEASGAQILPPVTTAKITTRRSFNFKYGRVEVRAKLPSGSWLIPEINLESSTLAYGTENYESGLIRIAFNRGNPSLAKKLYGGPVLTNSEPFRSMLLKEKIGIENWHNDFHNYTLIWRPDGIDLLVDGEQYGSINPGGGFFEIAKKQQVSHASLWQKGTVMAPLDQMFHLALGLRAGGVNDFSDDLENKPWKNSGSKAMYDFWRDKDTWYPSWYNGAMKVDYVRVYAL